MTTDHKLSPLECQIMGAIAAYGDGKAVKLTDLWLHFDGLNVMQFRGAIEQLWERGLIVRTKHHALLTPAGSAYVWAEAFDHFVERINRVLDQCDESGFSTEAQHQTKAVNHEGGTGVVANRKPSTINTKGGAEQSSSAPTVSPLWVRAGIETARELDERLKGLSVNGELAEA